MTNPPNIDAIIAELSEATGPSRELDVEIHRWTRARLIDDTTYMYFGAGRDGRYLTYRLPHRWPWSRLLAPAFTASLDATKAMLPPKTLWAVGSMEDGPFARLCAPMRGGTYVGGYIEATAATVELAFVIAALRVRSALIGEVGRDG